MFKEMINGLKNENKTITREEVRTEMFKEMINGLKNENKTIIREEVRTAVEETNRKILGETKWRGNFVNTVPFAQIVDNNAGFPVLLISSQERESVLLS
ncbi:hypothetical protein AVEN_229017-1 [Araneus ventricosus]|uniref:Uncharacterized protein n=1 Tax=Araneus ventricosus TaxID=182803 RepID=A0A4Y2KNN4_ARAVE|nr:hypothetical protein AVEN_229017-1 [Araneus ventricosus]